MQDRIESVENTVGRLRRPDPDRGGLHQFAARPPHERVLHGRARAGAGRSSGDPAVDQRDGGDLSAWPASGRSSATVHSEIAAAGSIASCTCRSNPGELVAKHEMQRELGRRTGTCFQRCVGLDAIGTCHSVTFDIDAKHGTEYHERFLAFLQRAQTANVVIGGAMTDPKGDRSKAPHQQSDPDLFLRVVRRDDKGIYVSGAKMHQTGAVNSHWLIFMPTMRMTEADRDWSVVGAVRVDAPGLTYVVGRQTNDTRIVDGGAHRCRQCAVRRPGVADRLRRRVRAARARVHGRRVGVRLVAGRALHHLSSLVLRLQNRVSATC